MRTSLNVVAAAILWFGFTMAFGHVSFTPGMTAALVRLSSYFGFNGDEAVEDFFMILSAVVALFLATGVVWLGNQAVRRRTIVLETN